MIVYFNNPYDKISVNTLQFLFVNDYYPTVINRTSPADDRGLWISFLPTIVLCSDDYKTEYARIENYKCITPDAMQWLTTQQARILAGQPIDPTDAPPGVIIK